MSEETPPELIEFRKQIDALDQELIDVLARRFQVVHNVGVFKTAANMEAIQPVRAQAVKDRAVQMGIDSGLDGDFVRRIYDAMIDYAHDMEHDILDEAKSG